MLRRAVGLGAEEATGRVDQLALAVKSLRLERICESADIGLPPRRVALERHLTGVTLRIARHNGEPPLRILARVTGADDHKISRLAP